MKIRERSENFHFRGEGEGCSIKGWSENFRFQGEVALLGGLIFEQEVDTPLHTMAQEGLSQ